MSNIRIEESNMVFEFPEEDVFRIENCSTVKAIGEGVKIVEMIVKHNTRLIFIEAKNSSPRPVSGNNVRFDEFMQEIYEKFCNSLILLAGIALNRPFKANSPLPASLTVPTIASMPIHFYLIINNHKEEWLPPLNDELNRLLGAVKKCFAIERVNVLNDLMARKLQLISAQTA